MPSPGFSSGEPYINEPRIESPQLAPFWTPMGQQSIFRRLMEAFAYPGRVQVLPGACAGETLLGVLATLVDGSVTLADPDHLLPAEEWSRLEARRGAPEQARFVLVRGDSAPVFAPALGSLESPEAGATLLLRVAALGEGLPLRISGPGVDGEELLSVSGLHPAWLDRRESWNAGFPMGVDLLLIGPAQASALPRSSRVRLPGAA